MKTCIIRVTTALIAAVLATTVWGLEVGRTKTEAEIVPPTPITPVIELSFRAQLFNDGFGGLADIDVIVTWEQVGGVEPTPFLEISIPAGCFVRNRGFHVENFRACGVQMTFGKSGESTDLEILEFESRLVPRTDGSARFAVQTSFMSQDQAHAILGALGGAAIEIATDLGTGASLPRRIGMLSGVTPEPF